MFTVYLLIGALKHYWKVFGIGTKMVVSQPKAVLEKYSANFISNEH